MNKITQHIPTFVDYREPAPSYEFNSIEELLAMPFVNEHAQNNKFYRFSISGHHLMAERDNGGWWWVVGYIAEPNRINLPEWKGKTND